METIEKEIRQYLVARGWDNLRPSDVAKSISIEAAELLEIFQWSNPTLAEKRADAEKLSRLKGELADVLIYALDMAVLLELDAAQLIRDKIKKIEEKYPAELMKQEASNSEPGTDSVYLQRKRQYRREQA